MFKGVKVIDNVNGNFIFNVLIFKEVRKGK